VLHYAVMSQKKDVVEMLLDLGVDPRGGSGVNGTAIDVAKSTGQTDILELLERAATDCFFARVSNFCAIREGS
jgi:ankyrin repeat protein